MAAAIGQLFVGEGDRAVLVRALLEGSSPDVAIAALNEHLGDVARALTVGRTVPRSMGRVALAAGTLASVLEVGASVSSSSGAAWAPALWEFLAGCVGAAAALEIHRRSEVLAERVRAGWDDVAAVFEKRLGAPGGARGHAGAPRAR